MVTTAASVEWTVVASDVEALQLEYHLDQGVRSAVQRAVQGRQVVPVPGDHLGRRGAARHGHAQPRHPRRAVLRAVSRRSGPCTRRIDLMLKLFPIRTCKDCDYRRAMASGRPCFAGPDRQVRRPVLGNGHDRGARADRRPVRRASWQNQDQRILGELTQADAGGRRRAGLRGGGAPARPAAGASTRVLREERRRARRDTSTPTSSASTTTSSRPRCSSSSCAAVASAVCARGRSTRSSTSPLGELVDSVLQNAYGDELTRRPRGGRARAARRRRRRSRTWLGSARASARCGCASRSAATRPSCSARPR